MFTPGPSKKLAPRERASRPICVPISTARSRSQLAARPMPAAYAVEGGGTCAPTGPSLILNAGIPSRCNPVEAIMLEPDNMEIFSSSVILEMASLIFFSSSALCARPATPPATRVQNPIAKDRIKPREMLRGLTDFITCSMLPPGIGTRSFYCKGRDPCRPWPCPQAGLAGQSPAPREPRITP